MVDKNLFLYDLAVVAIMKGEEPYVKEWIDYHLLAGVDHFYIYDNDSTPEFKKILQPYIDAGIVTYTFYPGKARQYEAYNAAVRDYKFLCRYMAFIDADEFIFPKSKPTIIEVVDEVLPNFEYTAALAVNWIMFGSNNLETADYSRGILERFTRRDSDANKHVKIIADPRKLDYFCNPHYAFHLAGYWTSDENGTKVIGAFNEPPTAEKICINHYYMKSREEYAKKSVRGTADSRQVTYKAENFSHEKFNDVFDDSILKYRDARLAAFNCDVKKIPVDDESRCEKVFKALTFALLPGFNEKDPLGFFDNPALRYEYFNVLAKFLDNAPQDFFKDRLEIYLTCFAVSSYLKENFLDEYFGGLFEEFSLNAAVRSLQASVNAPELQLLIKTLPKILATPYPAVNEFIKAFKMILPEFMNLFRVYSESAWKNFVHLDYLLQLLEVFDIKKR